MKEFLLLCFFIHTVIGQAPSSSCSEFEIRLAQTPPLVATNTGRLEICKKGVWGTIEGPRFWPRKNIQVACQQMGYAGALNAIPSKGLVLDQDFPVHFRDVVCDGRESNFSQCEVSPVSQPHHSKDVYIACLPNQENYSILHTLAEGSFAAGDFRLVGNSENGRGAVEIYTSQGLATVCPDSNWNSQVAQIFCESLGYESGEVENIVLEPSTVAPRSVFGIECLQTNGTSRFQTGKCSFTRHGSCKSHENLYAGLVCSSASAEGSMRLRGNAKQKYGTVVEIFFNERWGLLCRPSNVRKVAASVCDWFGFSRKNASLVNTPNTSEYRAFESHLKPIWVPDLVCTGSRSLENCTLSSPIGYGNCPNGELLLVKCKAKDGKGKDKYFISVVMLQVLVAVVIASLFIMEVLYIINKRLEHQPRPSCLPAPATPVSPAPPTPALSPNPPAPPTMTVTPTPATPITPTAPPAFCQWETGRSIKKEQQ